MNRAAGGLNEADPVRRLVRIGVAYVEFGRRFPHHLQIMFGAQIEDLEAHADLARTARAAFDMLADTVRAGQQAGRIRSGDERAVTLAAWSLVHGLAMLLAADRIHLGEPAEADARSLSERVVRLLETGLAAETGSR